MDGSASLNPESSCEDSFQQEDWALKIKHCLSSWSLTLFLPLQLFCFQQKWVTQAFGRNEGHVNSENPDVFALFLTVKFNMKTSQNLSYFYFDLFSITF